MWFRDSLPRHLTTCGQARWRRKLECFQSQRLKCVWRWKWRIFCKFSGRRGMLCCATWTGREREIGLHSVLTTVTSHAIALPACQGIKVLPSWRLPSTLTRPVGSFTNGTLALHRAHKMRSLILWWRAILPKAKRHDRPWESLASAIFPQGQSWGVQRSTPSLKPTATLTASISRRRPKVEIGSAWSQSLLCGVETAENLAWW